MAIKKKARALKVKKPRAVNHVAIHNCRIGHVLRMDKQMENMLNQPTFTPEAKATCKRIISELETLYAQIQTRIEV